MSSHLPRQIVIVTNGSFTVELGQIKTTRTIKTFLRELSYFFDKIIMPQFVFEDSNNLSDWNLLDIDQIKIKNLSIFKKSNSLFVKTLNYLASLFFIVRIVLSNSCLYIFLPGHIPLLFVVTCLVLKKKYALYVRGDWVKGKGCNIEKFYPVLFRSAQFILAPDENYCKKINPWNENTEKVVPMIELERNDLYIRKSYALDSPTNLLFVGRIEKEKGIFELFDAFEALFKNNNNLHLIVAGDGADFIRLQTLCKLKGLTEGVFLLGLIKNKEELKEIYKNADIFVFPSYHEGFPRVLYEAMTFGLPIITTFVGGIDSVMEDGVNCLRVKEQDVDDLKNKVLKLLHEKLLREEVGQGGTQTMEQLFKGFGTNSHDKQVIKWIKKTKFSLGQ